MKYILIAMLVVSGNSFANVGVKIDPPTPERPGCVNPNSLGC